MFATHGYQAGSFQDVADRVGMSQSSLFHYFPTKRDLLVAVLERRDSTRGMQGDRSHARSYIDAAVGLARSNASVPGVIELYTVLAGESVTLEHPAREYFVKRFANLRAEIAADLRHLKESGQLRAGVDPDRAATSFIALWDGAQLQWLLDGSIDVAGCLRDYLESILQLEPSP